MPGEPAETMLGVAALGAGTLLLVCAYKNVSPVALVRRAVTTGQLSFDDLPSLYLAPGTTGDALGKTAKGLAEMGPVIIAIDTIKKADKALGDEIDKEVASVLAASSSGKPKTRADVSHLLDLLQQARNKGLSQSADTIEKWLNTVVTV